MPLLPREDEKTATPPSQLEIRAPAATDQIKHGHSPSPNTARNPMNPGHPNSQQIITKPASHPACGKAPSCPARNESSQTKPQENRNRNQRKEKRETKPKIRDRSAHKALLTEVKGSQNACSPIKAQTQNA